MKKALPIFLWLPLSILTLSVSLLLLLKSSYTAPLLASNAEQAENGSVLGTYGSAVISDDARSRIVSQFLKRYNCPLTPHERYAEVFVETADTYHLDFRLLPAIAMQESNCCKKIPENSNNCWGYGIYGDKVTRFDSFEQAIDQVGRTLAVKYTGKGFVEVDDIMSMYTPRSNGSWAAGVLHFMNQMK